MRRIHDGKAMQLTPRSWFDLTGGATLAVLRGVPRGAWEKPGLGGWNMRELAAHTIRSWRLVVDYLNEPLPEGDPVSAARYIAVGLTQPDVHAGVLARGQQDAETLGDIVEAAVNSAEVARDRLSREPDERLLPTRFGPMSLSEFLRTRAFEFTIHGIDLARATHQPVPDGLIAATVPTMALLAEVAVHRGSAASLLLAATGRDALPEGFTLLE